MFVSQSTTSRSIAVALVLVAALSVAACSGQSTSSPPTQVSRTQAIPASAVKGTPETDVLPPVLHADEWETPIPMPGPINTAGAEDSPFMAGDEFYFFFTPDATVPPEKQLVDGVTGAWVSRRSNGQWGEPERVFLGGNPSLDGVQFVQGDVMWFASVRAGNYGEVDLYTAERKNGRWTHFRNAGKQLNQEYDIGELHFTPDGQFLYCGTASQYSDASHKDIMGLEKTQNGWGRPEPLPSPINTPDHAEDLPFITADGQELWFTGDSRLGFPGPAIYRSLKQPDGSWGKPTEILSSFAGEPNLDEQGNIYFVHHYFTRDMQMIEADIYVARRR